MMKAIGGYFELADREQECSLPIDGIALNTCRNALEYIILQLQDIRHIYLPLYTCEAVIEPLKRLPISYSFYYINEQFELADDIELKDGEYIIANNYFGIKDSYISSLVGKYGSRLIVDNAQAFFAPVCSDVMAAYSSRKYLGVADGGIAVGVSSKDLMTYEEDNSSEHNSHLLIRKQRGAEAGFKDFQANECKLDNQPIRRMSAYTEDILAHISYERVIAKRRSNYEYLHQALAEYNLLHLPSMDTFVCPMVYPFISRKDDSLRERLIENKIFVARYWPNVLEWAKPQDKEYEFASKLIPLPIDQRYGEEDMERIIKIFKQ